MDSFLSTTISARVVVCVQRYIHRSTDVDLPLILDVRTFLKIVSTSIGDLQVPNGAVIGEEPPPIVVVMILIGLEVVVEVDATATACLTNSARVLNMYPKTTERG